MDWRSVKFDWNRARAFLVTAEEGSFSAAARALDMSQPTLGRQVSALEEELGVALFEKSGRGVNLTPGGLALMEHVRGMADAANRLSLSASGRAQSLEGNICITATEVTAAYVLPPILEKLRLKEPGISIEVIASNTTSDLKRREADIAIRSFRPTQPDLIAKKLLDINVRLYATPDYLKRIGQPTKPSDLSRADFVGVDRGTLYIDALNQLGLELTPKNFPIVTESHLVHWELAKQGVAVGVMPEDIGDREPAVVRALPDLPPFPIELWLVAHREVKTSRRVRTVFDFLADELVQASRGSAAY